MTYLLYYARCCRVHKLVMGYRVGRCGLCGDWPEFPASEAEYLAQPPLKLNAAFRPVR